MKLAVVAAGFTPGEADQLRRAMAAWRRKGGLEPFRRKLVDGMAANGYDAEFAERVYKQICGFGEYGFPESHAASFALLVYVSAWLKRYHPAVFTASLLNSQPMGFYAPAQLIADARRHGVEVRPPDVNASDWDCTLEDITGSPSPSLRLGLRMISGLPYAAVEQILRSRQHSPFRSIEEFLSRTGLARSLCQHLARADAFASLGIGRRQALWKALPGRESGQLFLHLPDTEPAAPLPKLSPMREVTADYQTIGLSLRAHPFQFLRDRVASLGVVPAKELEQLADGQRVKVAGLVLLRQRPGTAKGVTFVTLEDETGQVNLVVWQSVWDRYRRVARSASAMLITGHLQKAEGIIHVVAQRIQDLSEHLESVPNRSRDFR